MGLIKGSIYALLAISFSLIFGVARIVNIAHTAFYMVAAYSIYTVTNYLGWHPVPAMLIAIVISILLGMITYKIFLNPIREHEGAVLIATMAIAMIFQEIMTLAFTGTYLSVPNLIEGFIEILGVKVFNQQLLTLGAAVLVMVLLVLFLFKTNLGLALRSTAQDREVANLMGINESKVAMITMGIAIGLAGFAGAIVVPLEILEPHMWTTPLVMMMAVVVLGGLGSLKGSFVGAYIMGFTEASVVFLSPQGAFLKISVALLIMIIVLLIRPEGLFGVYFEEER
jgi:branched-chain amino acid transport system permease protein